MSVDIKKFLDLIGLGTFLENIKYNYSQGSSGYVPLKATKLESPATITLSGAVNGSASFDGSENITITTTGASEANVIENIGWKQSGSPTTITWITPTTIGSGQDAKNKAIVIDLSGYALKSDISSVLNFKGTKTGDQIALLTASEVSTGDVWSCTSDSTGNPVEFHADYEYAAVVTEEIPAQGEPGDPDYEPAIPASLTWTELGKFIDLSGYATVSSLSSVATSGSYNDLLDKPFGETTVFNLPLASITYDESEDTISLTPSDNIPYLTSSDPEWVPWEDTQWIGDVYTWGGERTEWAWGNAAILDLSEYISTASDFGNIKVRVTCDGVVSDITPAIYSSNNYYVGQASNRDQTPVEFTHPYRIEFRFSSSSPYADVFIYIEKSESHEIEFSLLDVQITQIDSKFIPAAPSISNGSTGFTTGGQVYSYVQSNKGDANVIEAVKLNGNIITPDSNKAVNIDLSGYALTTDISDFIELTDLSATDSVPSGQTGAYVTGVSYDNTSGVFTVSKSGKGTVADNDTKLVDGDTVYDYIEAMSIPDATINALFPANPPSGS